ncbi:UNVERIFIED_CONTAM: hypothetical protein GTU68_058424 [Idotea baltica]|nr:hypothetical protein [Idotea baltica]
MPEYKAPLRDVSFVMNELLESEKLYQTLPGFEEASQDMLDAIVGEAAKFCEEVIAPLNQPGDEEGCQWSAEGVKTPEGFPAAYQQYVANGWPALAAEVEHGGQGMPNMLGICVTEFTGSANWSWGMYPGLSHGAIKTIEEHGDAQQKDHYLTKLISGSWTGTMCLTESQCGTDLGLLTTKAEPQADGSYSITGTKIFISAGEHDMAENIVHIVLARLPDAPAGTKGISLFIVPKFNLAADGAVGERNGVHCASIEKKMGIKASATCVMNFDGAKGFLIGPPNKGMACMFTFMNTARLGTGTTGIQAMDLIGRKVLGSGGKLLMGFTTIVNEFCEANTAEEDAVFVTRLKDFVDEWLEMSMTIGTAAMENPDAAGAAAVDYLMYSGYVTLGYFWARMAVLARKKIAEAEGDVSFYEAKLMTAQFYFERILPRTRAHKKSLLSGPESIMQMPEAMFDF